MSNAEKKVKLFNRIAAVLMALLLLCQFMPYWHYGEGDALSASVNEYVWFPYHHEELTDELTANYADYSINDVAWPTIGVFVLCVAGVIFCLWKSRSVISCVLPIAGGVFGLWLYLSTPAMKAGGFWWLHVALLVLMLVCGVAGIVMNRSGEKE